MTLPRIRGTQIGLRDPDLVDRIKADMTMGRYAFDEDRGRIGGVIDPKGAYHVFEGHHRMVAALEIFRESGDEKPVLALLNFGRWTRLEKRPVDSRPFPSRSMWGAFRNWLGFRMEITHERYLH